MFEYYQHSSTPQEGVSARRRARGAIRDAVGVLFLRTQANHKRTLRVSTSFRDRACRILVSCFAPNSVLALMWLFDPTATQKQAAEVVVARSSTTSTLPRPRKASVRGVELVVLYVLRLVLFWRTQSNHTRTLRVSTSFPDRVCRVLVSCFAQKTEVNDRRVHRLPFVRKES